MGTKEQNAEGGRKGSRKGVPNKNLEPIREMFTKLVSATLPELESDLKSLSPKERIDAIVKLSQFCIPQLARTELLNADDSVLKISVTRHTIPNP